MMDSVRFFVGIFLICNLLYLSSCSNVEDKWPNTTFSSSEWKSTPEPKRYIYFKNLISSKKLDDLTENEVINLLGQPNFKSSNEKYFTYILKHAEKGEYSLNFIYLLHIDFSPEGKVSKYFLRAD